MGDAGRKWKREQCFGLELMKNWWKFVKKANANEVSIKSFSSFIQIHPSLFLGDFWMRLMSRPRHPQQLLFLQFLLNHISKQNQISGEKEAMKYKTKNNTIKLGGWKIVNRGLFFSIHWFIENSQQTEVLYYSLFPSNCYKRMFQKKESNSQT